MPLPIDYCPEQFHQMWDRGDSCEAIAAYLGCSTSFVTKLARRHGLPRRQRPVREIFDSDPTLEDIERMKRELRERHMAEMRAMG